MRRLSPRRKIFGAAVVGSRWSSAGGLRLGAGHRCGALFFCVVAVGDRRVWVLTLLCLRDPNAEIGLVLCVLLLETVSASVKLKLQT